MKALALSVVAAAVLASGPAHAQRYVAPWCAVLHMGWTVQMDCRYPSIEACRPNVIAGNRGYCTQNPAWVPPPPKRTRTR